MSPRAPLLVACLALGACADEPCRPPRCDVRKEGCQRQIMQATACLRGVEPVEVSVSFVDRDALVDGSELVGDMLTLWADQATDAPLAIWRLRFSSRTHVDEVVSLADGRRVGSGVLTVLQDDRDAILIGSEDLETVDALGELTWGPVPQEADDASDAARHRTACRLRDPADLQL